MFRDQTHIDADTFIHPCLIYAATRGVGVGGNRDCCQVLATVVLEL